MRVDGDQPGLGVQPQGPTRAAVRQWLTTCSQLSWRITCEVIQTFRKLSVSGLTSTTAHFGFAPAFSIWSSRNSAVRESPHGTAMLTARGAGSRPSSALNRALTRLASTAAPVRDEPKKAKAGGRGSAFAAASAWLPLGNRVSG